MRRFLARLLGTTFSLAAVGLAAVGCADHGSYSVEWDFVGQQDPHMGCGAHGVDSIRIIGTNTAGDGENLIVLCTEGGVTHSVLVGTWTMNVQQFDVRGVLITPFQLDDQGQVVLDVNRNPVPAPDPTITGDVVKDQTHPLDPEMETVHLTPRPACGDGIDNDGDRRVDLDDPDCNRDLNKTTELPPS